MKIRKQITLSEDVIEYLESINGSGISKTIELIVRQHKDMNGEQMKVLANMILNMFEEKYKNMFTRIRLASNSSDINSQIILEILNSIILNSEIEQYYSTDIYESDIIKDSKKSVKDRIARLKQIKDNKIVKGRK